MIKRNLKRKSNNLPQLWNSRKVVEKLFKRRQITKYISVYWGNVRDLLKVRQKKVIRELTQVFLS